MLEAPLNASFMRSGARTPRYPSKHMFDSAKAATMTMSHSRDLNSRHPSFIWWMIDSLGMCSSTTCRGERSCQTRKPATRNVAALVRIAQPAPAVLTITPAVLAPMM